MLVCSVERSLTTPFESTTTWYLWTSFSSYLRVLSATDVFTLSLLVVDSRKDPCYLLTSTCRIRSRNISVSTCTAHGHNIFSLQFFFVILNYPECLRLLFSNYCLLYFFFIYLFNFLKAVQLRYTWNHSVLWKQMNNVV